MWITTATFHMSSRQNPLHLGICYCNYTGYRFFWGGISLSSLLRHYRFWRGPYRFRVFRAHLWQKCFCNTTGVFNHFDRNSHIFNVHQNMIIITIRIVMLDDSSMAIINIIISISAIIIRMELIVNHPIPYPLAMMIWHFGTWMWKNREHERSLKDIC